MKQLIFFRRFLIMMLVLSQCIFHQACRKDFIGDPPITYADQKISDISDPGLVASSIVSKTYLDLNKDQVVTGGITSAMLQSYLNQGYLLKTLGKDQFAKQVSFKDKNGNIYRKDGWLKKGTKYLIKSKFEPVILSACANEKWWYGKDPWG